MILELPREDPTARAVAELTALVGARVVGEHRHPGVVERFTVLEGELTVKHDGKTSILQDVAGLDDGADVLPGLRHQRW